MHKESYQLMEWMLVNLKLTDGKNRICYDIGSYDVNGTYRPILDKFKWKYIGMDIEAGKNVDIVINDPEIFTTLDKADLVISGQCIEHVLRPWIWIKQAAMLLNPGGYLLLVAPAIWPNHRYPVDCWRFQPDGYSVLAEEGGLELIKSNLSNVYEYRYSYNNGYNEQVQQLQDCWAVMRKPNE